MKSFLIKTQPCLIYRNQKGSWVQQLLPNWLRTDVLFDKVL